MIDLLACKFYSEVPELEEDGIRIALTVVDTPGFGDNIDNEPSSVRLVYCLSNDA